MAIDSTPDRDRIAALLPAYEIGDELGRGGFGLVLAGKHRSLGREVAIKQLPKEFAQDPSLRERFRNEARVMAGFDCTHIAQVHDFVDDDDMCLLVMERLDGGTVWSKFTSTGMSHEASCSAAIATCEGLHYAHTKGVLHRDVKPENLMFNAAGTLRVTDFGIAKLMRGGSSVETSIGMVIGTPSYMAPEQALAGDLTPATDVYALGMVLFELLSGYLPFPHDPNPMSLLYSRVHTAPRQLLELAPAVPQPIAEAVMGALAREPEQRWTSAEAFGSGLARACNAAWGPGWVGRHGFRVVASGRIADALSQSGQTPAAVPQLPAGPVSVRATALRDGTMLNPSTQAPAPPVGPTPMPTPAPAYAPPYTPPPTPMPGPSAPPPKKGKGALIGGIAALVVVVLIAVAAVLASGGKSKDDPVSDETTITTETTVDPSTETTLDTTETTDTTLSTEPGLDPKTVASYQAAESVFVTTFQEITKDLQADRDAQNFDAMVQDDRSLRTAMFAFDAAVRKLTFPETMTDDVNGFLEASGNAIEAFDDQAGQTTIDDFFSIDGKLGETVNAFFEASKLLDRDLGLPENDLG